MSKVVSDSNLEEFGRRLKTKLSDVATSGDYSDLSNTPTIPTVNNATVSVQMNGSSVGSFTTNQASAGTINLGTVLTSHQNISGKEDTSNKVTTLDSSAVHFPTCSAVSSAITSAVNDINSEEWTFELEDGTTVTKTVLLS